MAECVCVAQAFTRETEAKWAVSLRDVARFQKLFCYFYVKNARDFVTEPRSFFSAAFSNKRNYSN